MAGVRISRGADKPNITRGASGSVATLRPVTGSQGPQGLPGPGSAAWTAAQAVVIGSVRQAPDGSWIKSTANRTTGATFDVTEQGFWAPTSATSGTLEQVALSATFVSPTGKTTSAATATAPLPWINVVDRGVTPVSSAAVNTAAIQGAIDAGGTVLLPPYTVAINAKLTGGSNLNIRGVGKGLSKIQGALGTALLSGTNTATRYYSWKLEGFTLDNTDRATAGGIGLDLTNISLADVDVHCENVETGVKAFEAAYYNNVHVRTNGTITALRIGGTVSSNECEWHLRANDTVDGVIIDRATNQVFIKPAIELFTGTGFDIANTAATQYITLFAPRFENSGGVGVGVRNRALAQSTMWVGGMTTGLASDYINDAADLQFLVLKPNFPSLALPTNSLILYEGLTKRAKLYANSSTVFFRNSTDTVYYSTDMLDLTVRGKAAIPVLYKAPASQTLAANGAVTIPSTADQNITLQANATSSTISGSPVGGQQLIITWIQDATGGRTYVWPTNCKFAGGAAPSDTTASKRTSVTFRYDSGNWYELDRAVAVG